MVKNRLSEFFCFSQRHIFLFTGCKELFKRFGVVETKLWCSAISVVSFVIIMVVSFVDIMVGSLDISNVLHGQIMGLLHGISI